MNRYFTFDVSRLTLEVLFRMLMPNSLVLIIVIMFMFLVLVVAGLAVIIWALSRSGILGGTSTERTAAAVPYPDDDALDIIRRRYARGEITYDEYEALRKNLEM